MGVIGRKAREILLIPKGENEMSRIGKLPIEIPQGV